MLEEGGMIEGEKSKGEERQILKRQSFCLLTKIISRFWMKKVIQLLLWALGAEPEETEGVA